MRKENGGKGYQGVAKLLRKQHKKSLRLYNPHPHPLWKFFKKLSPPPHTPILMRADHCSI